ncbi:adenosylhomocysteine nucleosidase [Bradyrhizobium sp. JR7.2]
MKKICLRSDNNALQRSLATRSPLPTAHDKPYLSIEPERSLMVHVEASPLEHNVRASTPRSQQVNLKSRRATDYNNPLLKSDRLTAPNRRRAMCFAAIVAVFLTQLMDYAASAKQTNLTPRIAVICAYSPEWLALKSAMSEVRTEIIADTTYIIGKLENREVVLFLSGVSMVNAAMTTQGAIDHFKITRIVFSGIAGGINPNLSAGDVVVADRWFEYLESVFARKTGTGWSVPDWLGKTKPNYGMIFPYAVGIAHPGQSKPEKRFWFDVDPSMLEAARSVAAKIELRACIKKDVCLGHTPRVVIGGAGVSGPAFVDNADFRTWIYDTFKANSVDNESAAVAHVAYSNHIPFIAFRGLSDLAGGDIGENTEDALESLASDNSAAVVEVFLRALPN